MKITVFSKRDIITHPLSVSLLENWAKIAEVEYFTIHTNLVLDNSTVNQITAKKYLIHTKFKRYLLTVFFYFKMIAKITQLRKQYIYLPFSNIINLFFFKF